MRFQFSKGESRDRVIFRADLDDKEFCSENDSKRASVMSLKNVTITYFLLCSGDGAPDSAATSDRGRSS